MEFWHTKNKGGNMQLRETVVKGLLKDFCFKAQNSLNNIVIYLSDAPENIAIQEDVNAIVDKIAKLSKRFE